jgi:EAL and modified HD-GYP domain-containing signal transduction protein
MQRVVLIHASVRSRAPLGCRSSWHGPASPTHARVAGVLSLKPVFDSSLVLEARPVAGQLDAVRMGWSVVVARDARPVGFRLAVVPRVPGAAPQSVVLENVLAGFTGEDTPGFPHGLVLLAPHGLPLDEGLLHWRPPRNVLLEVPQDVLDDEASTQLLYEVQRHGIRLALRARPGATVPRDRLALFQYVIDAVGSPRPPGDVALIATGAASRAQAEAAFKQGASAVLGWPAEAAPPGAGLQPQQHAVLELIRMVQADADLRDLDRAFKSEPLLAYLLLTLANSPAFVRTSPIASLSQAIGLLGYKRLLKWLVLLLVIASKSSRSLPAIYGAVARGFTMEHLAAAASLPVNARDESFVVGVFSLLDRVTGQPLSALVGENALPEAVSEALLAGIGPYASYLALAAQLDGLGVVGDAVPVALAPAAINGALLLALSVNDALQSVV